MKKAIVIELLSMLLIILFFYTGAGKLVDFKGFAKSMHKQHFTFWLETLLTYTLPLAEIAAAGLMLFKRTRFQGYCLSLGLLIAFTGYIAAVLLHFFAQVPCPCGGVIKYFSWGQHLLFTLFFLVVNVAALMLTKTYPINEDDKMPAGTTVRHKDISRAK